MNSRSKHRGLKLILAGLALPVILTIGSCADYNSNTNDASAYRARAGDPLDPNFAPAYEILMTKCYWCHDRHDYFASLNTSQKWVDSGQVVKQSPNTSYLIQRLKRFNGGNNSNMPVGEDITQDEYNTLINWVQNIP
jgi:uncharacterized membrane protein